MSDAFALVKFKTTGNIYYGCYDGTSDILLPFLCTPEECYDEKLDCYCSIMHCQNLLAPNKKWTPPIDARIDAVEIYSDYGGGFYWSGTGAEEFKMVRDGLDPFGCYFDTEDGIPDWAKAFLERLEKKHG